MTPQSRACLKFMGQTVRTSLQHCKQ